MAKRLSVILGDSDEQCIERFMDLSSVERAVLQQWVARNGGGRVGSEASVIRALMQAGAAALQDEVLDAAYSDLAVLYDDTAMAAERRAARDRYVDRIEASVDAARD